MNSLSPESPKLSLFALATNWASACLSASEEYYSESKQAVIDRAREAFIAALAQATPSIPQAQLAHVHEAVPDELQAQRRGQHPTGASGK